MMKGCKKKKRIFSFLLRVAVGTGWQSPGVLDLEVHFTGERLVNNKAKDRAEKTRARQGGEGGGFSSYLIVSRRVAGRTSGGKKLSHSYLPYWERS